ncbi:uncharacterized protein BT62DRAFT_81468 [Guyanagaster necrorhizus]|uniref:Uncharacterized protein n=1 Tax=Guyanagaster necrorhizus TaxID=856835 RepID=A0A9P7VV46_9AGAR|nr:uncharacterized protein BT62DRAFT_81468 [Guyanagaster necrorhizus MCA 3950]KAG7447422.1 hypothetical protein BT62DRAFT_81468 [Guyanagaster necrorhizus MCA 3950]
MNVPNPHSNSYSRPFDFYMKPKNQLTIKDFPRQSPQTVDRNHVRRKCKKATMDAKRFAEEQRPQQKRCGPQTYGANKPQGEEIQYNENDEANIMNESEPQREEPIANGPMQRVKSVYAAFYGQLQSKISILEQERNLQLSRIATLEQEIAHLVKTIADLRTNNSELEVQLAEIVSRETTGSMGQC